MDQAVFLDHISRPAELQTTESLLAILLNPHRYHCLLHNRTLGGLTKSGKNNSNFYNNGTSTDG